MEINDNAPLHPRSPMGRGKSRYSKKLKKFGYNRRAVKHYNGRNEEASTYGRAGHSSYWD